MTSADAVLPTAAQSVTEPAAASAAEPAREPAAEPAADPAGVRVRWISIADYAIKCLSPDSYFNKGKSIIRGSVVNTRTVRSWEDSLKAVLASWASQHRTIGLEATTRVLQQLKQTSQWGSMRAASAGRRIEPREFYTMLRGLDQKGMLPILTFSFDRRNCERLASEYSSRLQFFWT